MTYWNFVVSKVTGLFEMANSVLNKGVNATDSFDFAEALQGLSPQVLADLKNKEALLDLSDEAFDGLSDEALDEFSAKIDALSTKTEEYSRSVDRCMKAHGIPYIFFPNKNTKNKPLNQNDETIYPGFSPTQSCTVL